MHITVRLPVLRCCAPCTQTAGPLGFFRPLGTLLTRMSSYVLLLQYYWGDGSYIGGLNPRQANPYVHVSHLACLLVHSTSPVQSQALTGMQPWPGACAYCQDL